MFKKGKPAETSQRFTIRKYHFGAASVLLGTFFTLGANAASAEEATKPAVTENLQTTQTTTAPPVTTAGEKFAKAVTGAAVEQTVPKSVEVSEEAKEVGALVKELVATTEAPKTETTTEAPKTETTTEAPKTETTTEAKKEEVAKETKKEAPKAFTYTVEYREKATNTVVKKEVKTSETALTQVTATTVVTDKANKLYHLDSQEATVRNVLLNHGTEEENKVVLYVNRQSSANPRNRKEGELAEEGTGFRSADAPAVQEPEIGASAVTTLKAPALTVVANSNELTEDEKKLVAREIAVTNPGLVLTAENGQIPDELIVANDGSVTVNFKDQKTGQVLGTEQLPAIQTVVFSARTGDQNALNKQIYWFDFSSANIEYLVNGNYTTDKTTARYVKDQDGLISEVLQEGMRFKINPIPNYNLELTVKDLKPFLNTETGNAESGKTNTYHKLASEQYNYTAGNQAQRANIVKTLTNTRTFRVGEQIPAGTTYVVPNATIPTVGGKQVAKGAYLTTGDQLVEETNINGTVFAAGTTIGSNARLVNHFVLKTATANTVATGTEVAGTYTTYQQGDTIAAGAYVLEDTQMTYDSNVVEPVVKATLNGRDVDYTFRTEKGTSTLNKEVDVTTGDVIKAGAVIKDATKITWKEAPIILRKQNDKGKSTIKEAGLSTGEGLTNFMNTWDAANWGVEFDVKSSYLGRVVPTNALLADGETSEHSEATIFRATNKDNSTKFQIFADVAKPGTKKGYDISTDQIMNTYARGDINGDGNQDRAFADAGFDATKWVNPSAAKYPTNPVLGSGAGTNQVGPTANWHDAASPVWLAQGAEKVELYYNGAGRGSLQLGFVMYDGGDAPQSYGTAQHMIREEQPEPGKTGAYIVQPFLGSTKADPDTQTTASDPAGAWALDDVVYTEGATVTPDEGEKQLLDEKVSPRYNIRVATDREYVLEGIEVNLGRSADGQATNQTAYVRSWVDFNNDGQFNPNESSMVVTVTRDENKYNEVKAAGRPAYLVTQGDSTTVDIQFRETPQLLDTSIDKVGVRVRVSTHEGDVLSPTGVASSGEVEDFEAYSTHKPRGTEATTSNYQDQLQTYTTPLNSFFVATGKVAPEFNTWAEIDTVYTTPKIVVTETVVDATKNAPTGNKVNIVDNKGNVFYSGDEVKIYDAKGNELGTAIKVQNDLNGTTEYLLSSYTEYDTAGNKVGDYNVATAQAGPITNLTINFDPAAGYVGIANGIAIRAWDTNGHSTGWGVSETTIEEALRLSATGELAEKDVIDHNINDGGKINGRTSMDSTYIPTVIDVRPVSEDVRTEDIQGKEQSAKPQIPIYGTVETNTGKDAEEIYINNKHVILDPNVKVTFTQVTTSDRPSDEIPAGTSVVGQRVLEGSVTLDNVRILRGSTVPAGAVLRGELQAPTDVTVSINNQDVVIQKGQNIPQGAKVVVPFIAGANFGYNNVTFEAGQEIPNTASGNNGLATLTSKVSADTFAPEGESITLGNATYNNYKVAERSLADVKLPDATHIDPVTGVVSTVARSYTTLSDTLIVIKGEGKYELNQDTGIVTFTPEPSFVGEGVGIRVKQPDIDYDTRVPNDDVTIFYGKDYGEAAYIPTVTPTSRASITRTIHYVYKEATDPNQATEATGTEAEFDYNKGNEALFKVDNKPVTTTQTLQYTREYFVASGSRTVTDKEYVTSLEITDAAGTPYKVGDTIKVGTKFNEGQVIVGAWTALDNKNTMERIVSPNLEGYTATVVMNNYKSDANGTDTATHTYMSPTNKQTVGRYTSLKGKSVDQSGRVEDVGTYTPLVSEVRSDDLDDINVYVVYEAFKQKAIVNFYDIFTGKPVLLETADKTTAPTTLEGDATTPIPYDTKAVIDKYVALGYELVSDQLAGTKPRFDTVDDVDQTFNVYLTHKTVLDANQDPEKVTRTIVYKYEDGSPVLNPDKSPKTVTETLTFTRTKEIDQVTKKAVNNPWSLTGDTGTSTAPEDNGAFDKVESPVLEGYTADKSAVDRTDKIDAEASDFVVEVIYKANPQNSTVTYIDKTSGKILEVATLDGKTGDPIKHDTAAVIKKYEAQGYKLVENGDGFANAPAEDKKYDTEDDISGSTDPFVVYLEQDITEIPITTPVQPGQQIPGTNFNAPADFKLTEEVTRTVEYVYNDGKPVPANLVSTPVETKTFTREATINKVTGEIKYGEWTPAQTFAEVAVKPLPGYVSDVKTVEADTVNAEDKDITEKVIYTPVGTWKPVLPPGVTPPAGVTIPENGYPYPDPKEDPTKPGTDTPPTVPFIPGTIPYGPDGKPLVPVDPKDPSKGYTPPSIPNDPTQDTTITYTLDGSQVAVTKFVLDADKTTAVAPSVVDTGDATKPFNKDKEVADTIKDLEAKGYEVVTNEYTNATKVFDTTPDKDGKVSQEFVVTVAPKVVPYKPVDGQNPPVPGQPVDPKNPDGPKWPDSVKDLVTTETVTRTINYVYSDGKPVPAELVSTPVETKTFTREAEINLVTGEITYKPWSTPQTFAEVAVKPIPGHVSDRPTVEADNVNATSEDITETVIYTPVGTWKPVLPPGVTPPAGVTIPENGYPYPDPKEDPTKPGIDTPPTTPIPYIPGTIPVDPEGNPLKPVDPLDPTKGYNPPVPTDPTQDTTIVYTKEGSQVAVTKFVREDNKAVAVAPSVVDTGDAEEAFTKDQAIADTIKALEARGFEVVSNNYPTNGKFDEKPDRNGTVSQQFEVVVREKVVPTPNFDPKNPNDPNTPKPGQPVDPNNPEGPKWPESVKDLVTTESVTRTVKYVYTKDGSEASKDVTETVNFTRTAKINLVTGVIEYGEWVAENNDTTFDKVDSPVIAKHIANKASVAELSGVKATDADITEVVSYSPIGSWVPVVPPGETPIDPKPYPNDPNDPTKPGVPTETIPHVPGTIPYGPDGNPLTPVDPNDPTKGYNPPPVPTNPTDNTIIVYVKADDQRARTTFEDVDGNTVATAIVDAGKEGTGLNRGTDVTNTISGLLARGYEVVSNNYPENGTFDNVADKDGTFSQEYKVVVKPRVVPTIDPKDPNAKPPVPGEPVDPKDPTGPKWPDSVKNLDVEESVTRTVKYVYATNDEKNGTEASATVSETVKFTRTAKVNLVTGEIEYGNWTAVNSDSTFDEVKSPVITGYLADKATVTEKSGVQAKDGDTTEVVTYRPIGTYVPNVPEGMTPLDPIPYPNDPNDPTKPGVPTNPIPHIPGTTPKDPNGNPLTPVDPNDPTKGYNPPPFDPTNPGNNTPISYVKDDQKAIINFVTEDDKGVRTTKESVEENGKSSEPIDSTDYATKLAGFIAAGYEVVSDNFGGNKAFDTNKDVDQTFEVVLKERTVPAINPFDPNSKPPVPGQPVDPNDPTGPKWPEKVKDLVTEETVTRTITYVYEDGSPVLNADGTPKTVTETLTFKRTAQINLVTGEPTYGEWSSNDTTFDEVKTPVLTGYLADKAVVEAVGAKATDEDTTEKVTYRKIATWTPILPPGVTPPPGVDLTPKPYPNDPNDPTKPGTDLPPVPHIPGTTPKDPNGNPLTPVDPNDPTKGYIPPTPTNPGQPTPINYEVNKSTVTVNYVDGNGNTVSPAETLNGKVGEDYTSTAKVIPGYLLVKTPENATGKFVDGGSTVTYVYNPIGSYVPNVPGVNIPPIPYPNDPNDPTKPGVPTTPIPYVPGYTPLDPTDPSGNTPLTPVDPNDPTKGYNPPPFNPNNPGQNTPINYVAKSSVTVTYVDENGNALAPAEKLSGKVGDDYTSTAKVIPGYLLVGVPANATGKFVEDGSVVTYVYKPIGSYVPNVPGGNVPAIPYPNDPNDPTKPGVPTTPIPYVPGYTPLDPTDPSGNTPLTPVDPNDPTKGYNPPPFNPNNPGQNTPINYVANKSTVTVSYVDGNGNPVAPTETLNGRIGEDYTSTAKVVPGYLLVKTPENATGKFVDGGSTVTYVYNPIGSYVPNVPGVNVPAIPYPNDPNDPTKPGVPTTPIPYVPGYTPLDPTDPSGNTPLTPVDPNDPTKGYNPPPFNPNNPGQNTPINYVANKSTVTVSYVDGNGNPVAPTETLNGRVGEDYTSTAKVVPGYLLVEVPANATGKFVDGGSTVTYTYVPIGSYVPNVPGGNVPAIPYPNDPTDPTKPGVPTTPIPHVPGFVPFGPDGNPLVPVDPNDLTKGYIPPVPTNPAEDTPINYVKIEVPNTPDTDGDGIPDIVEIEDGTDPRNPDTDGGGVPDGEEKRRGTNPLDPADDKKSPAKPKAKPTTKVAKKASAKALPKTSATTETNSALPAGLAAVLAAAGVLVGRRRKKEDK